ncbi:MAG TPA: hypothetical protein VMA72_08490 [Streptosporangiaceae bacterium]|nr:hypothetical protein [Streptosporangiaceae bacterium]
MARIWRDSPGRLLALYLVLGVIALAVSHSSPSAKSQLLWFLLEVFLAWRVWRGGRTSRVVLILVSMISFGGAAFTGPRLWSFGVLALLAIYAAQVALLVSPAVYQRTRRDASPDWSPAASMRWTPPVWMPLSALLAGLLAILASLASMGWAAIPGCGPAGATIAQLPARCFGLAQGYPVRFLTANQGAALIDKAGLAKDWAHWSIVSFAVFYLLLLLHRRHEATAELTVTAEDPAVA